MEKQDLGKLFLQNYAALKSLDEDNKLLTYFHEGYTPSKDQKFLTMDIKGLEAELGIDLASKIQSQSDLHRSGADILYQEFWMRKAENSQLKVDERIHELFQINAENPIKEFCRFDENGVFIDYLAQGFAGGNLYDYLEFFNVDSLPTNEFHRDAVILDRLFDAVDYLIVEENLNKP